MIFNSIKQLRPYFFSLREIDDNISLDMKFPVFWKYDYEDKSINIISQDKNDKVNLVSFITPATKEGYDSVFNAVLSIIKFNLEREEKERLFQQKRTELNELFQQKINELQELFANESLDKLKEINIKENERPKDNTGDGVVEQGDK